MTVRMGVQVALHITSKAVPHAPQFMQCGNLALHPEGESSCSSATFMMLLQAADSSSDSDQDASQDSSAESQAPSDRSDSFVTTASSSAYIFRPKEHVLQGCEAVQSFHILKQSVRKACPPVSWRQPLPQLAGSVKGALLTGLF